MTHGSSRIADGSTQPSPAHILMCEPAHYGIEYEINPWMSHSRQSDRQVAAAQWRELKRTLEEAGATISLMEPVEGLPDLVFTANSGLVFQQVVILSRFRHRERQGEEPHDAAWFESRGFEVRRVREGGYFEGAGDALFCGDTLFAGYRIRSDARTLQEVGAMLDCRVIPLELIDPYYYHLDTCFCPLAPGVAVYYPGAFDGYGRHALGELVGDLIEVDGDEARRFSCNAVVVGQTVVTNTGCHKLHAELTRRGYQPIETPLDEFVKAGGSAKCLTLRLDGEEAAAWKRKGV